MTDDFASKISGLEKASVLLMCLGVDVSSKVLQYLSESEIERVLLALSRTTVVPPEVRHVVLEEAHELTNEGVGVVANGIDYSRQLLSRAVGPRRGAEILERISAHQQLSSFEMLKNADPAQVANLLQDELPQTIALVLSYLEAKVAADILTNFPKELQIEVTLRLATMDRVSPQVVQVVERDLKNKLSGVLSEADFRATGGVSFLVKMLNQVDRGVQKTILEALEATNPKLVEEIRANMFTFDDLIKLDDRTMQRVLRDVNKSDLALALKAAPERLKEAVFRNLSERARENLKEEIEILGPQLAKNVYAAQRRIVEAVRALEEAGEIVIAGGGAEYEIIQ
ncbi:flagellar motor switch protein FliG [uncultured Thermanaerothrix sp.]|uniref:flagellar motor switch protein FliG n=1 Tax=uncultured Thermanaerothrix sp. TaxID=1195149 RepID=UPI002627793D|nr:flagellar motor switch protein FliG [uncultured Thermanaerothrix sp.]